MEQIQALELGIKLIESGEKHRDYEHTVNLACKYERYITGHGMEGELIQYVQRETEEAFLQRARITKQITPAIAGSLMNPFDKVGRNNKVKKRFDFKGDKNTNANVQQIVDGFYGDPFSEDTGLDGWLNERFKYYTFFDPNAWIVTEWTVESAGALPVAHPFEVTAEDAWHFSIKNNRLRWLWVHECITVKYIDEDGNIKERDGDKWTLYEEDNTIVFCEVCRKIIEDEGGIGPDQEFYKKGEDRDFLITSYDPRLGYVAARRVGYCPDGVTKGRTFVNPFHVAMTFMEKSVKLVSELDLAMAQHAFPQKLQYVQKCEGESKAKRCVAGKVNGTTQICPVCNGKGYAIHSSAQDAILLPMPKAGETVAVTLDQMLVYKAPPVDLVKFQKEYIDDLKLDAYVTVFQSQLYLQSTAAKTATEIDNNTDGVQDVLSKYAEKISQIWKAQVFTFAKIAGMADPGEGDIVHKFPADFKLKSLSALLNDLKAANDSGAPSFLIEAINRDIAAITFEGDDFGYMKYEIKKKFHPFTGKTAEEVQLLMAGDNISKFDKVLYANFEPIFFEIEAENKTFWTEQNLSTQWGIVEAKVAEFTAQLTTNEPRIIVMGADTPGLSGVDISKIGINTEKEEDEVIDSVGGTELETTED
jgi:hypothetical protein